MGAPPAARSFSNSPFCLQPPAGFLFPVPVSRGLTRRRAPGISGSGAAGASPSHGSVASRAFFVDLTQSDWAGYSALFLATGRRSPTFALVALELPLGV